jgi:D-alanyl-D-alanine carboxypeptidase
MTGRHQILDFCRIFSGSFILFALVFGATPTQAAPSLIVDVASGQVLAEDEATASWFPASTTKLMTVYVALDAVRAGRLTMDTPLMVSPRAARMAPSKMGFRPGTEVTLQNALIMLMVKSANDIAVTIAEGVSGSVEAFADDMNRASASLGMTQSRWVNPNGLPDARQVTSARDLAILGRALYTHFPEYATLFNIGAMQFGRHIEPNHNGLIGRYPGADGMKTGFTCPAGFNVVASATRGGRHLIVVVLGAPTAIARTAKAVALFDRGFQTSSGQTSLASLSAPGPTDAPDLRNRVCRNRGAATAEFMAEVENTPVAMGASTGVPLFDAVAGAGQPTMTPTDVARLPRPHFQPTQVHVGRAEGYTGPVARTRAPGSPIGEGTDLEAYANDNVAPEPEAKLSKRRLIKKRTSQPATPETATESSSSEPREAPSAASVKRAKSAATKSSKTATAIKTTSSNDATSENQLNKATTPKPAKARSKLPSSTPEGGKQ